MQQQSEDGFRRIVELCASSVRRTFVDHIPLYVCSTLFTLATLCLAAAYRIPLPFAASLFFLKLVVEFLLAGIVLGGAFHLAKRLRMGERPSSPLRLCARWAADRLTFEDRPGNILHSVLAIAPLMISFNAMKEVIPQIHPFSWDRTFMQWDRFIGFGHLPWQILQPVLGYFPVTAAMNSAYDLWFGLMFGSVFWIAFASRGSLVRTQYLLAFAISWFFAGNILATLFSSAGPCFYGLLKLGTDPYASQMTYLHAASQHWPIGSVWLQDMLWSTYTTGYGVIGGISAFPSMHVEIAALVALLGWRVNRGLGMALAGYVAVVFVASICLGWHYAVDGIAGILLAVGIWFLAGAIARAWAVFCEHSIAEGSVQTPGRGIFARSGRYLRAVLQNLRAPGAAAQGPRERDIHSTMQHALFCIAAAVCLTDAVWIVYGHFQVDTRAYMLLLVAILVLVIGSLLYNRVRVDREISALFAAAAFLIAFPAGACLFSYLATTIAGPRIDDALASVDHAMGFSWLDAMALAARHPFVTGVLRLTYNSIIPQTIFLMVALGWARKSSQIYGMCIAMVVGTVLTISIWIATPSFGAFSVFHLQSLVATRLGISDDSTYANQLALMLKHGPGFISPTDLRGVIACPSYHTVQALMMTWYARKLPYIRWIAVGLNASILPATIVHGGHHLIDIFAGAAVGAISVVLADVLVSAAQRVRPKAVRAGREIAPVLPLAEPGLHS
jgi:hypothetical protein